MRKLNYSKHNTMKSQKKVNILNREYKKALEKLVDVSEERWDIYDEIITECVEYLGTVAFDEIK